PNGIARKQGALAQWFHGSGSATQSGASSVGPSKKRWRQKEPPGLLLKAPRGAKALAGDRISAPCGSRIISCAVSKTVPEGELGLYAARARNRPSLSAARGAGSGEAGKTLESPISGGSGAAPGG